MKWPLALVLLAGCGVTEQTRRTFPVEVVVSGPAAPLESGWSLSSLEGSMSLTEVRFFEGRVLVAEQRWNPFNLILSTAHAHPGHYVPGAAKGELVAPLELDLSKRDVLPWQVANAVTGAYGSAQLTFGPSGVRVRGSATKAARTIRFDTGPLTLAKPLSGLQFEHEMTTAAGRVRLEVDLGVLLSRIEFDKADTAPNADGVVLLDPSSIAFNGFVRGVTDAGSYRFTWHSN
jgi:hypothetical protein